MANKNWFGFTVSHQFIITWLSLASFLHNILMNGANNVIISSLQKEFYLSSRETGSYVSIYDVGSLFSAVVIPFVSAHGSKPRWISFGMVMLFVGCQVTVIPHFLRKSAINEAAKDNSIELCNNPSYKPMIVQYSQVVSFVNESSQQPEIVQPIATKSFFQLKHLLYVGNIINGLSSASMTSLAFSYIEDIAPAKRSAVYESVYYATGALGMGVGFIITSNCLLFHTDFNRPDNVLPDWLQSNHPNWIGAWWLPFIIFGFIALLLAIVIFLFPRKIENDDSDNESEITHRELTKDDLKNSSELVKLNDNKPKSDFKENEFEATVNGNNLISTLQVTGSIISMNKVGFYTSQEVIDGKKEVSSLKLSDDSSDAANTSSSYIGLLKKTGSLFLNPVYVFILIASTIEGLLQNSFLAFASLFLEYQYRISSGYAALIIGFLSIPPLIFGGLLSGYICKRLKNDTVSCFKFITMILFVNVIIYSGFLIYCQQPVLISSTNHQDFTTLLQEHGINSSSQSCYKTASSCNCDTGIFKPVCLKGSRDIYFQSPCLAGCKNYTKHTSDKQDFYSDCSQSQCQHYFDQTLHETSGQFVDGLCPNSSCTVKLVVTYTCIFFLMLLNALLFLPYLKVTIGSVNSKEMNTIVLGLKQFFMNALGTIPGPILFGSVIDLTCNYWHTDSSGQRVCKMYNNQKFAMGFGMLGMGFKTICFVLMLFSLIISIRKRRNRTNNDKETAIKQ